MVIAQRWLRYFTDSEGNNLTILEPQRGDVEGKNWVKPLLCLQRSHSIDHRKNFFGFRKSSENVVRLDVEVWNLILFRRRHVCFKAIMSSKKKKSEGKSGEVEKAEEIFQAVILSDSFNFRFLPITLETPRVSETQITCTLPQNYQSKVSICF